MAWKGGNGTCAVPHWEACGCTPHLHPSCPSFDSFLTMRQCSRAQQELNRAAVLAMDQLDPKPAMRQIAGRLELSPSTVQSALKTFRDRDTVKDLPRRGCLMVQNARWRRCVKSSKNSQYVSTVPTASQAFGEHLPKAQGLQDSSGVGEGDV